MDIVDRNTGLPDSLTNHRTFQRFAFIKDELRSVYWAIGMFLLLLLFSNLAGMVILMNEQVYTGVPTCRLWTLGVQWVFCLPVRAGPVIASQYHASHCDLGEPGCLSNHGQRRTSGPDGWR